LVQAISGHFSDLETVLSFKDFFADLGVSSIEYEDFSYSFVTDFRFLFLLNSTLASLEFSSIILLIGTNLRTEVPLLNSRIRKNYLLTNKLLTVFSLGLALDYLTFPVKNLGNSILNFKNIFQGKSIFLRNLLFKDFFSTTFVNFNFIFHAYPKFFIGASILNRSDNASIFNILLVTLNKFFKTSLISSFISIVSPYLGRLSVNEIGFSPGINSNFSVKGTPSMIYLVGVDNFYADVTRSFLVYQGIFKANSFLFRRANLIFPTTSFVERDSSFLNIEGRLRFTKRIIIPFKFIFSDWDIFKGLSIKKKRFLYFNFSILTNFYLLAFFKGLIMYRCSFVQDLSYLSDRLSLISGYILSVKSFYLVAYAFFFPHLVLTKAFNNILLNSVINRSINNYYSSDMYSKNSKVMSLCAVKIVSSNFSSSN